MQQKEKSTHILIIPSWYPRNTQDIGGSFFREQAIALEKKGYKVGVIHPQIRSARDIVGIITKPYGLKKENDSDVTTFRWHSANFFPKMPKLARARWLSLGMKLFDTYVKENGFPDIIHVHSLLNAGILAYKIAQIHDIPYIVTEHSTAYARKLINESEIRTLYPIINNAFCCLAVSQKFSYLLNKIFKTNKWEYLPNIVNNNFLKAPLESQYGEQFTFINICLLDKKKRVDLLLHAFSKITKKTPNLHLKIGGNGPERQYLESLASKLQISDKVTFLGMLPREKVLNEIQEADAFVLSSEFETFGVVLIEALALGKPIIATKCGGPESIIIPDVGFLVENGSVDQLASAMLELYENRDKYKSQEIRDYCYENFSEDAVINKLSTLYQQILDE